MAAKLTSLPERLKYLQPFRKKVGSKQPVELNEDTCAEPLMKLLAKRLAGQSEDNAKALIQGDLAELELWLMAPENQGDSLQWVAGFLTILKNEVPMLVDERAAPPKRARQKIGIKLPLGAKSQPLKSRNRLGFTISWDDFSAAIMPFDSESFGLFLKSDQSEDQEDVTYGPVVGKKSIRTGLRRDGPFRQINYLLSVPGGHISVVALFEGHQIDMAPNFERLLEDALRTVTVT